ncbi:MAG: serine/threonine protein kinase [Tannerella sp.]|jgi:serine/threonine-protein kinase|nr:serine/threonine protein kinase [Tannerella sp.]
MNLPDGYFLQNRKYQLTHTIGQGGFGITYLGVWNTVVKGGLGAMKTKVPVCIKEYFFKDYCYRDRDSYAVKVHSATGERLFDKFKEKLIKEANILSEVHHPHIVNVLEVFEENNTAYIIMEYIKGCSLKYMLDKEGVLSENRLLRYVHQIGNALDFVHDKNIVHLDIKPSNILIDKDDNARLIDFGVSKRYDIEERVTSTTTLTLSKGFAAIEQYDDEGTQTFSPCPDIYSLGATMYNLLTGVIPVESILRATKQMLPPSSYNANITKKTEKAILKAMEVKPEDRFQVVKEMLASLDIPPYEFSENNLVETKQATEDELTEAINARSSLKSGDDDDGTVVLPASAGDKQQGSVPYPKRKIEKRLLLAVVILCFAFLGYAVYSYFTDVTISRDFISGINMPGENDGTLDSVPGTSDDNGLGAVSGESVQDTLQEPENTAQQIQSSANDDVSTTPEINSGSNHTSVPNPETNPGRHVTSNTKPEVTSSQPTGNSAVETVPENAAKMEKEYSDLIASAKVKMRNSNYKGAHADLMTAVNIKTTEEAIELIHQCKEEEEKIKIKERLSKYQVLNTIDFGNLKIVRHLETMLFGAINEKGEERIPCKYIGVDQSINGRAFLRKDHLYDVYNEKGVCIATALVRYD